MKKKDRVNVFERTTADEEKLADAIANLEMAELHIRNVCQDGTPTPGQKECLDKLQVLIKDTLEYLRGIEIRNEIEDFSHFNDIES